MDLIILYGYMISSRTTALSDICVISSTTTTKQNWVQAISRNYTWENLLVEKCVWINLNTTVRHFAHSLHYLVSIVDLICQTSSKKKVNKSVSAGGNFNLSETPAEALHIQTQAEKLNSAVDHLLLIDYSTNITLITRRE